MGAAPAVAILIGSVVSAAATAYAGYQQQQQGKYNEKILKEEGRAARQKAKYDETAHRERVRSLLSRQRALYGASGVTQQGSPSLALQETVARGEMDAQAIRYGGQVAERSMRNRGQLRRREGQAAFQSGLVRAGGTLLQGYGQYRTAP